MKRLFSGNSDLIAVVAVVLALGVGSRIESEVLSRPEIGHRVITRTRMVESRINSRLTTRVLSKVRLPLENVVCPW
jgi:hypothetical protein